jgi:hypothetical protein
VLEQSLERLYVLGFNRVYELFVGIFFALENFGLLELQGEKLD